MRLGPLGRRLAVAFLAVALIALAVFGVLTLLAERHDVSSLGKTHRTVATGAIASAAETAYQAAGGWSGADVRPVDAMGNLSSTATELTTASGVVVTRSGPVGLLRTGAAVHTTRPVIVGGRIVGWLNFAFAPGGLTGPEQRLRSHLAQAAGLAALVAVLVALAASLGLTGIVARRLRRLAVAAHAIGRGDRQVRIGPRAGPGELAELGDAFDSMVVALDRAERARQALVADVAHELRTPVAILQAETEALVDGVRPVTPETLASLHEEAVRLGQRIEDLQTLASADAAGLSLERRCVDLGDTAAHAADLLAGRFTAAGLRLERSLAPAPVWGDARRLHQVVTNLLDNACKFTPSGGVVRLEVHPVNGQGELTVADSGPGVPPEERSRVFDRFYRGSAGVRTAGSGIGLAVVAQIVGALGGEVAIGDPPDGGACFVVRLPAADGGDRPGSAAGTRAPAPPALSTPSPSQPHSACTPPCSTALRWRTNRTSPQSHRPSS